MSSAGHSPQASVSSQPTSIPPDAPFSGATPKPVASPTLFVTYGERSVKARIDPEVPLAEIIRQLAASSQLGVSEPPALFALRSKDDGELITDENLGRYLDRGQAYVRLAVFFLFPCGDLLQGGGAPL